jgi:hypothetical protein
MPSLATNECSVCLLPRNWFAVAACMKPLKPDGHEPSVCWSCITTTCASVEDGGTAPCPLCRHPIERAQKWTYDQLQVENTVPEIEWASSTDMALQHIRMTRTGGTVGATGGGAAPDRRSAFSSWSPFLRHMRNTGVRVPVQYHSDIHDFEVGEWERAFRSLARRHTYGRTVTIGEEARITGGCKLLLSHFVSAPHLVNSQGCCVSCLTPIGLHD